MLEKDFQARLLLLGTVLAVAACGGGGGDGGSTPGGGSSYVSGPTSQDSATVSVQGRDVVLARGTEAGVESLSHQGQTRYYLLIRPQVLSGRHPVLVLLHGNAGTPEGMANIAKASALVASQGAIAVMPEALDGRWSEDPADSRGIDDVGFLSALAQRLRATANVEDAQIYLAGFSNGGAMVQRHACANPASYVAYGVVAAVLRPSIAASCATAPARPITYMLGTLDPVVAFDGISGFSSAASSVGHWVQAQGCGAAQEEALPNTAVDGTTTDLIRYPGCAEGNELRFYRINGGGHAWPGGEFQGLSSSIGLTAQDYSATEAFWDYFGAYRD
jgi:polyhydroxybutyrate depolymerase